MGDLGAQRNPEVAGLKPLHAHLLARSRSVLSSRRVHCALSRARLRLL